MDINKIGVVIIGRNEGKRLIKCLNSTLTENTNVVYVDSNSTDNSVKNAKDSGAAVIDLDMSKPFSAARARNTGWQYLIVQHPEIEYIQFIDGDCELQTTWLEQARGFLHNNTEYAIVCGRRRERFPEATLYNQFCDDEWNTPVGDALSCGGDALIRTKCLQEVNGYKDFFVAGEEPEMCYRLRQNNWKIFRLNEEMTLHDANITRFTQWWKRANRSGFAFALSAKEHGKEKEKYCVREAIRPLMWTGAFFTILILSLFSPFLLITLLIFPLQIIKMYLKKTDKSLYGLKSCLFLMISKFPEALGVVDLMIKTIKKQDYTIIEYK
ncbi:glycosyltransferase [Colwellia sp. Bg11-28]|uniref:glycosyltransferase n=1 Tax=Colwellia sp. Bg11-28 TaxID=2058305 RepID=UPI000C321930|nr:glycosyltransferase [Colwellia sp. Bg11-28]PKH85166.1 glycosyl transferase [Colwellia sp. Bg11-28]